MGQANTCNIIRDIDGVKSEAEAMTSINRLFDVYDVDGSEYLKGVEFDGLIEALTEYIFENSEDKGKFDGRKIRTWLKSQLDADGNKKITKREFLSRAYRVIKLIHAEDFH
jgi:hypothetical protein